MREHYLQILGLGPHASDDQIKSAFRELSKKYHPDLNQSTDAHEKFIEVKDAYMFLTGSQSEPVFVWMGPDPEELEKERRKKEHIRRLNAEKFARHRQQLRLMKRINNGFRPLALVILGLNSIFALDYLLPYNSIDQKVMAIQKVYETTRHTKVYRYDKVIFEDYSMVFELGKVSNRNIGEKAKVNVTSLISIPMSAQLSINGRLTSLKQSYNIYRIFGFLIPLMVIVGNLFFYLKKPSSRFNMVIILSFFAFLQMILFVFLS